MEFQGDGDKRDVRRPMNAFLIFCKRHRSMVREKNPDLDNRNVTRILGDLWANLPEQEKTVYTDLAKQYKDAFMKANPDYKWHNPEKVQAGQKVVPRPTNMKVIKNEVDLLPEGSIMPGKLADPSDMGGLSLLLMAGQQSLRPKYTENQPKNGENQSNQSKDGVSNQKKDFNDSQSKPEKKNGTNEKSTNQSTMLVPSSGENSRGTSNTLLELAEMCSNELGTKKPKTSQDQNGSGKILKPPFYRSSLLAEALLEVSEKGGNSHHTKGSHPDSTSCKEAENLPKQVKFKHERKLSSTDIPEEEMKTSEEVCDVGLKSEDEESAIVTCGKMVVNHIIDKIFSSVSPDLKEIEGKRVEQHANLKLKEQMKGSRADEKGANGKEMAPKTNGVKSDSLKEIEMAELQKKISCEEPKLKEELKEELKFMGGTKESEEMKKNTADVGQNGSIMSCTNKKSGKLSEDFLLKDGDNVNKQLMENGTLKKKIRAEKKTNFEEKKLHGNGKQNGNSRKSQSGTKENLGSKQDEVDGIVGQRKRSLTFDPKEDDTESDERGDNHQPVRKSRRRNRGQRYQELINEGIIQPSKERLAAILHDKHDESEEEEFQSIDAHILPETAIRRIRKRTASESDKGKAAMLEDAKRYKTGDFDLEAHIATLPACSIDSVGRKRGFMKQRHNSESSCKRHDDSLESVILDEKQTVSLPPRVKIPSPEKNSEPVTGSRKRKARKHSITHLLPVPAGGIPASENLKKALVNNQAGSQKSGDKKPEVVARRRCVSFSGVIEKMGASGMQDSFLGSLSEFQSKSGILLNKENSSTVKMDGISSLRNWAISLNENKDGSQVLLPRKSTSEANFTNEKNTDKNGVDDTSSLKNKKQASSVEIKTELKNNTEHLSSGIHFSVESEHSSLSQFTKLKQHDVRKFQMRSDLKDGGIVQCKDEEMRIDEDKIEDENMLVLKKKNICLSEEKMEIEQSTGSEFQAGSDETIAGKMYLGMKAVCQSKLEEGALGMENSGCESERMDVQASDSKMGQDYTKLISKGCEGLCSNSDTDGTVDKRAILPSNLETNVCSNKQVGPEISCVLNMIVKNSDQTLMKEAMQVVDDKVAMTCDFDNGDETSFRHNGEMTLDCSASGVMEPVDKGNRSVLNVCDKGLIQEDGGQKSVKDENCNLEMQS